MGMSTISGTVGGMRERADVSGNREQVQTQRSVHLRIGHRAAFMKSSPHLIEGDLVTAVGKDGGEFEILALRNETSQVIYQALNPVMAMVGGVLMIFCSLLLAILIFPPFILIPMGIYMIWKGVQAQKAVKLLQATQAPQVASTPAS